MSFQNMKPIRTKLIMINGRMLEHVGYFNCLGNNISYDINYEIDVKLGKFQTICGMINRIFRYKIRRDAKLKFYKFMAVPALSYGCELWTTTKKQDSNCLLYTSRCV